MIPEKDLSCFSRRVPSPRRSLSCETSIRPSSDALCNSRSSSNCAAPSSWAVRTSIKHVAHARPCTGRRSKRPLQVTQLPPEPGIGNLGRNVIGLFQSLLDLGVEVPLVLVVIG